jgi:hypothetical protein
MKRMIDNKDYKILKSDVETIKQELANLEPIPTITIEASQMSGTTCQLTDEQFEILNSNPVVYIIMADGRTGTFFKETLASQSDTIINFISFANDVNQEDKVETYAFIMIIDTTDKTAIYSYNEIGGGKQLYQHNAIITYTFNGTTRMKLYPVINDSNVAFTQATFSKYLYDNNFKTKDNCWGLIGYHNLSGNVYFDGAYSLNGSSLKIYSSNVDLAYDITDFTDNVITI